MLPVIKLKLKTIAAVSLSFYKQ